MNKKKFPEGFFTKDRPIAKPKYLNSEDMLNNYEADCEVYENSGDSLDTELWMIDYLKNHSSADVQPVVHAHWENIGSGHAECSNCGMTVSADYPASPCVHYCAKCGARMDGDEHDNG